MQPVGKTYEIVEVPGIEPAVMVPLPVPPEATAVLVLLQVPPAVASVRVMVDPTQPFGTPWMDVLGLTVITEVATQLEESW